MLRFGVGALIVGVVALAIAQQAVGAAPWWLELSRYLPYPVLLAPALLALVLATALGRAWIVAAASGLLITATVTMGFVWHAPGDGRPRIRLMTYNVKAEQSRQRAGGRAEIAREVAAFAPDILVLQDAPGLLADVETAARATLAGLPAVHASGQYLIASRFPLRDCAPRRAGAGVQSLDYLRCTVEVDGVALTVLAVHLESPRIGLVAARHEGFEGVREWRRNVEDRLAQARALARDLAAVGRPLVVAGDLNAPESSPVVQELLDLGLRDAFASAGRGYGYTYGHRLRLGVSFLRIDHVLFSAGLAAVDCVVGGGAASDHRPVIADLVVERAGRALRPPGR